VYVAPWCGRRAVFKVRKRLAYRLEALDRAIRVQRTVREADMIHRAKQAGVPSPYLYLVDLPSSTIVMEFVKGERMKDFIASIPREESVSLFREFGGSVAKLHSCGIMHGDLTTSNVIVGRKGLVMIDFGLSVSSTRLEDQAVDLRLIKETLTGAHPALAKDALEALFQGYAGVLGERRLRAAMRQLRNIEQRGRYARVE
jgi:TP53 regulating kinase-like protein